MTFTETVSMTSLIVSLVALYYAAIKEAYLVRLALRRKDKSYKSYISVINNSKFPIEISAFGYVNENDKFYWVGGFACARQGEEATPPITITARSSYEASVIDYYVKEFDTENFGFVVQLVCGRTYFVNQGLPAVVALKYWGKCKLSTMTGGIAGFEKNYVHAKRYGD